MEISGVQPQPVEAGLFCMCLITQRYPCFVQFVVQKLKGSTRSVLSAANASL